jgi:hypothetical protein
VRIWPGSPLVNPTPEVTTSNLPGSITDPSASIAFISSAAFCANGCARDCASRQRRAYVQTEMAGVTSAPAAFNCSTPA